MAELHYRPTRLDKAIIAMFPGWGERRIIARHNLTFMQSSGSYPYGYRGYAGAIQDRKRQMQAGYRSMPVDEDSLTLGSLDTLRLECMDLYRNHPLCKSGINGIVNYLGETVPLAMTEATAPENQKKEAAKWDAEATDYYRNYFWKRADARRRPGVTHADHQRFVTIMAWVQGDMFFVYTPDGWLPIEGQRVQTPGTLMQDPTIVNGCRRDRTGRVTHIYVCERGHSGTVDTTKFTRIPMSSVLWCPWSWRPDQIRSVPRLHGVVDNLRDHEEIHEYIKLKIKKEAMTFTKEKAGSTRAVKPRMLTNSDNTKTEISEDHWGMHIRTNGDYEFMKGDTPNAQYIPTMEYDGKQISAGMGMPYEMLMHIYTSGSYTAQRAARMDFMHLLYSEWEWRINVFCQPTWNRVITEAMNEGHIRPAPVDARGYSLFHQVNWSVPYMREIDQGREARANKDQWDMAKISLADMARERKLTREQLLSAKAADIRAAIKLADDLTTPQQPVYWQDMITGNKYIAARDQNSASTPEGEQP